MKILQMYYLFCLSVFSQKYVVSPLWNRIAVAIRIGHFVTVKYFMYNLSSYHLEICIYVIVLSDC